MSFIKKNTVDCPGVFIGSSTKSIEIANCIQQLLANDFDAKVWNQEVFSLGRSILSALQFELNQVQFAVFIANDDDALMAEYENVFVPRDNVIFEIGMSIGVLGAERTFIVYDVDKKIKIPTNLKGVNLAGFRMRSDNDLLSSLGPVCNKIRLAINQFKNVKTRTQILVEENLRLKADQKKTEIPGKRLFTYKDYYPIKLDENHKPVIDEVVYSKALKYFLREDIHDDLAVLDLVYLRENNIEHSGDFLSRGDLRLYDQLIEKYDIDSTSFSEENKGLLKNYKRLINDLGVTFRDVHVEFLLHDVRNPIRSIVAAQNTESISGRRLGDPSTKFVYNYVVHQGKSLIKSMEDGTKVAYLKQLRKEKKVKATTIPIYDPKYGLIGIICINIDIDSIKYQNSFDQLTFFENYIRNSGFTPLFELEQYNPRIAG